MNGKEDIMGGMCQGQQALSSRMKETWRLPLVPGAGQPS